MIIHMMCLAQYWIRFCWDQSTSSQAETVLLKQLVSENGFKAASAV